MRSVHVFWILCLLCVLLSCSRKMRTSSDYDPMVNFAAYTSYAWLEPSTPRQLNTYQALVEQWIRDHVERLLTSKGLQKVTIDKASLQLIYTTSYSDKQDVYRDSRTYFYRHYGTLRSRTVESVYVRKYEEGILSIGMIDPTSERLVWYGGAAAEIDSPKDDKEKIKEAVGKILAQFPPSIAPEEPMGPSTS